jgi:hypothetical protein
MIQFRIFCFPPSSPTASRSLLFYVGVKHGLRVSEKRVVRRTFGPKREKVAGCWRRLHY